MRRNLLYLFVSLSLGLVPRAERAQSGSNAHPTGRPRTTISVTDEGWETATISSDCLAGWADDEWQLTLTAVRQVTIGVDDCCCPGDWFEVYLNGERIGSTPNLAPPWGCTGPGGPLSTGSATMTLCPGTYSIRIRDGGFDGHSAEEITSQGMCPAGFTVSGTLADPVQTSRTAAFEPKVVPPSDPPEAARVLLSDLSSVDPYLHFDDQGLQHFDRTAAVKAGASKSALQLADRLVELDNRIVAAGRLGIAAPISHEELMPFVPLFRYLAESGEPCGDQSHPTSCPPRVESGLGFMSEKSARQQLTSDGYHKTAGYAGNYGSGGKDYTKVVDYPGCPATSAFRSQAIVYQRFKCWSYNLQGPEPNPEILSYVGSWPYVTWPAYVIWWHMEYC